MLADRNAYSLTGNIHTVAQYFHVFKELVYTGIDAAIKRNNITYDAECIASLDGFVPRFMTNMKTPTKVKVVIFNANRETRKRNYSFILPCVLTMSSLKMYMKLWLCDPSVIITYR